MDGQLKAQLNQTIYRKALSSRNQYGDPTYGSKTSLAARVEELEDVITLGNGEQIATTHVIATEGAIAITDKIWLPGVDSTNDALARTPRSVAAAIDEQGSTDYYITKV